MPRISRDSRLRQWSSLLKAVHRTEGDLGGVAPFREALERAYAEAMTNRAVQAALKASARESTRRLEESFAAGGDAAVNLRTFIKSVLGARTERLRQFGIKPRRGRRASRAKAAIGFGPSS